MISAIKYAAWKWSNVSRNYINVSLGELRNALREHVACFDQRRMFLGVGATGINAVELDPDTFFDPASGKVFARIGATGGGKDDPQDPVVREISFLDSRFFEGGKTWQILVEHRHAD